MKLPGLVVLLCAGCLSLASVHASTQASPLPESVLAALRQANLPTDALSVVLAPVGQGQRPRLRHLADQPRQPASVIKLVTTYAGLDVLGPDFSWTTPVWLDGRITAEGVLQGHLVIQGQGDPTLVLERLWLLLHKVQSMGVRRIEGDIVLDNQAFDLAPSDPAGFDGEPLRPYNAAPDALLLNFRAISLTFTPDLAAGVARVQMDPPLLGVRVPASVPLSTPSHSPCVDYRAALKADFSDPQAIALAGHFSASCGEKVWPLAYAQPHSYNARAVAGLWQRMGGELTGQVRSGRAPLAAPSFVVPSPPLGTVIRDINKYSNNVMAQQLFLTLGRLPEQPSGNKRSNGANGTNGTNGVRQTTAPSQAPLAAATFERSRALVQRWWRARIQTTDVPEVDNGSGLSRHSRISAQALADMLQHAAASPFAAELTASLPITGIDGTLKRSKSTPANAHLKTGSLRGVVSLAGYVHADNGQTLCLVAIVNHERAQAARPALDALIDWAAHNR